MGPLPPVAPTELAELHVAAQGSPGQTVWPGLFPRRVAKLARLLLASHGAFDPSSLIRVAATQYGGDSKRSAKDARRYDAHDAFACALVHPAIDAQARADLVLVVLPLRPGRRGHRSRSKSWALVRWAVQAGYVDPSRLSAAILACLALPPPGSPDRLPLDPAPCGHAGALACLAACWPRFRSHLEREKKRAAWLDYPGIAELGHRHFAAFQSGCPAPWVQGVFDAIEHVLAHGDDPAQNLVVVGLFEAVQGDAYAAVPAGDAYEARLGPASRRAWADLIEGWTGSGIRDLAAWRKKARPA